MHPLRSYGNSPGFSLIGLIVAIIIMVALSGILAPMLKSSAGSPENAGEKETNPLSQMIDTLDDAKVVKMSSLVSTLKAAAYRYWIDTGKLPIESDALGRHDLFNQAPDVSHWNGPYLSSPIAAKDNPWRMPIEMMHNRDGSQCELRFVMPRQAAPAMSQFDLAVEPVDSLERKNPESSPTVSARLVLFQAR